jgi:hypothetical protein
MEPLSHFMQNQSVLLCEPPILEMTAERALRQPDLFVNWEFKSLKCDLETVFYGTSSAMENQEEDPSTTSAELERARYACVCASILDGYVMGAPESKGWQDIFVLYPLFKPAVEQLQRMPRLTLKDRLSYWDAAYEIAVDLLYLLDPVYRVGNMMTLVSLRKKLIESFKYELAREAARHWNAKVDELLSSDDDSKRQVGVKMFSILEAHVRTHETEPSLVLEPVPLSPCSVTAPPSSPTPSTPPLISSDSDSGDMSPTPSRYRSRRARRSRSRSPVKGKRGPPSGAYRVRSRETSPERPFDPLSLLA